MPPYDYPRHPFRAPAELTEGAGPRHPVVIVGAGPVGLTLALDLAQKQIDCVVVEAEDSYSQGSRALCWSQRSLDILDRLGAAAPIAARGFTWNTGRLFFGAEEVFQFDLQPDRDRKFPAFVNLQQYYAEEALVRAAGAAGNRIDLRWQSRLVDIEAAEDHTVAHIETPEGRYRLAGEYLIACDGARSSARRAMDLDFAGRVFEDHFLIADIDTGEELPTSDRRFWFLPQFHRGETALCHKQGEGMWRVDFQLGWDGVDPAEEVKPENALPRIRAMLGIEDVELTWASVYTFQCRRLERFRHGRVLFAGDAAHQVSPFGARGGNSGIQDAENLAWKLALVLRGEAEDALLDSYDDERGLAADENIEICSRTVDFMTARSPAQHLYRKAVLSLARRHQFARALIDSGRLSTPTVHAPSPLNAASDAFDGGVPPGGACPNVRLDPAAPFGHLLDALGRHPGFDLLVFGPPPAEPIDTDGPPVRIFSIGGAGGNGATAIPDPDGRIAAAFAAEPGTVYLLRPDQHVVGRWKSFVPATVAAAMRRAIGRAPAVPAAA